MAFKRKNPAAEVSANYHDSSYEESIGLGVPDWGPEDDHSCPTCEAPLDNDLRYCGDCSHPLIDKVAKCHECDSPLIDDVGNCPECGDAVYQFEDKCACWNESQGTCGFSFSIDYLEHLEMFPVRESMKALLNGGLIIHEIRDGQKPVIHRAAIAFSEKYGWYVNIATYDPERISPRKADR